MVTAPPYPLVLASASPRRRALLDALGVTCEVVPADVDEAPEPGEWPEVMAARLARTKATAVAASWTTAPLIVAADTVVVLDGRSLGKPADAEVNASFLRALAGRWHNVVTAHHFILGTRERAVSVTTRVRLRTLSDQEIRRWSESGLGLDKAGGYAIQDVGAALVADVRGCFTNVVGLSLPTVVREAAALGVALV